MPATERIQFVKTAPPPPELPVLGKVRPEECSFVGRTNYVTGIEEKRFVFGIQRADRRRHLYAVGKSGAGKSKFFELLARQDAAHGYGFCAVDFHGDLVGALLDSIPKERIGQVCVIDPSDTAFPVGWNPLADVPRELTHTFAQSLIEIMEKQFGVNWTPRLEHVFRFACLALLDYPHATMGGFVSLLTDGAYRAAVVKEVQDEFVRRFWADEFPEWSRRFEGDAVLPLVTKLSQFTLHPLVRNMFEQGRNTIDFKSLMAQEHIVLVNLARGNLGEHNANFLGALVVAKLKQAGMMRTNGADPRRRDFYVYLDEFQGLATETLENLLSEARKYGVCLSLSHQYLEQLTPRLQAAILGTMGCVVVFRASGGDAVRLEEEMTPVFKAKDMINLGTGSFYIKMTIDGETYDPFSAETLRALPLPAGSHRDAIVASSRARYATPRPGV
ncbi:MAG: type IV secretion system DNA-binding domain-containing protein [Candidatus Brennerbacteria bacterium]|nr:type IV secretion system DNA-binding domain-containing protein [Candidatus Brennerbacteria bacterium]